MDKEFVVEDARDLAGDHRARTLMITFGEEAWSSLTVLQKRLGTDRGKLLRIALSLLDEASKVVDDGGCVVFEGRDGSQEKVRLDLAVEESK